MSSAFSLSADIEAYPSGRAHSLQTDSQSMKHDGIVTLGKHWKMLEKIQALLKINLTVKEFPNEILEFILRRKLDRLNSKLDAQTD
ncbi:hypothetical protein Glove_226g42 [Diversispora epigaea]|uniref:Uncharacterized protein n=1 Tax=Diversispora epigaea TaxID=1348612 RepID=A0A397IJI5_9GLOM|nr:hypothetical protein Glove_226g42 [Diversispora epigaea]